MNGYFQKKIMTFAYLDFLVQLLAFKYQYNKNKFSIIGLISNLHFSNYKFTDKHVFFYVYMYHMLFESLVIIKNQNQKSFSLYWYTTVLF